MESLATRLLPNKPYMPKRLSSLMFYVHVHMRNPLAVGSAFCQGDSHRNYLNKKRYQQSEGCQMCAGL